jgi:hypothetical protein
MSHKDHIEEIAKEAAKLYGQEWGELNTGSRDRWIEAVRHTTRGGGEYILDRFAGRAIDEWYRRKEAGVVEPVEVKPAVTEPVVIESLPKPKKRGK